jgi:hypothetical protein
MKNMGKLKWLERLDRIRYEEALDETKDTLEHMTLASALLALAEIDHAQEYRLCRSVAERLLGRVPEPEDADVEDD